MNGIKSKDIVALEGELIAFSRLDYQEDPVKMHHLTMAYRHFAKFRFNAFVSELTALYGGDVKNIPASIVYAEDQVIDTFTDYCVRLTAGDLAKYAMTYDVFLKLYGENNNAQVPLIDQPYVNMRFFLFDSRKDTRKRTVPRLSVEVVAGMWVNTDSRSKRGTLESIESKAFHDGVECKKGAASS
jgi:hypothetical protein